MTSVIQPSLTGGELSPSLWGRIDLARYGNSLKTCKNFLVRAYGGVWNRPGTTFVAEVKDSTKKVRLVPFQYSSDLAYVLELGDGYLRVIANGGLVTDGGAVYVLATPWAAADLAALKFAQSASILTVVHESYPPKQIARYGSASWKIRDYGNLNGPWQSLNADKSVTVYPNGLLGSITITATDAIFTADKVGMQFYLEQENAGKVWNASADVSQGDIRVRSGRYYQAQGSGTTGTSGPSHDSGVASDGSINWLYLHSGWGYAKITAVAADHKSCTATVLSRMPDDSVLASGSPTATVTAVAKDSSTGYLKCTAAGHGWSGTKTADVVITFLDSSGDTQTFQLTALVKVVDASTLLVEVAYGSLTNFSSFTSGSITVGATYKWAFGAWGGDQGYPRATTYYQQRQVFGGTPEAPETFWLTKSGSYYDFGVSPSTEDDDAITATLGATQVNLIKSMVPLDRLIFLTSGGAWALTSGSDDAVTPSNMAAKQQSFRSCADVAPVTVNESGIYLIAKGRLVRDLAYDLATDKYAGSDLMAMASHLLDKHQVVSWAWHETPHQCLWLVRDDGVLLSCTYIREQEIVAWAQHDVGGVVESVAVISEGDEDALYLVVKRIINGSTRRYIERMASRLVTDVRGGVFLDCSLQYDGWNSGSTTITVTGGSAWDETEELTATASAATFSASNVGNQLVVKDTAGAYHRLTITSVTSTTVAKGTLERTLPAAFRGVGTAAWGWGKTTFSGLDHLEGQTVGILADGDVLPRQVVSGGTITLDRPAVQVTVGLPYDCDLAPLPVAPTVAQETLADKKKSIPSVSLRVWETRSVQVGEDYDHLLEAKPSEIEYDQPPELETGVVDIPISCSWGTDGAFVLRHSDPTPISVLALIPDVVVGGKG